MSKWIGFYKRGNMNRKTALALTQVAGYHQDSKALTRIRIEARVSWDALREAWAIGWKKKIAGIKCTCRECNPE